MEDLVAPLGPGDRVLGTRGPAIVEYGDYECPYSRLAYRLSQRLRRQLGELRFAFRQFPMTEIHPRAQLASEAAEAAAVQDRFWDMHDLLFHRQSDLEPSDLRSYARELDLDLARFAAELETGAHRARVAEQVEGGRRSGVRGVPTLFVDGRRYRGDLELAGLRDSVTADRA